MSKKIRLDTLVSSRGLTESREQAKRLIMAGKVSVDGQRMDKPGRLVASDADLAVKTPPPYVGRGGLKLEAALREFAVSPDGATCIDIGASTGGFTDCLLQHGARLVYALDVGHGQIHERLRANPRCVVIEDFNARNLVADSIPEAVDLAVMDVAFISVKKILPALRAILAPGAQVIVLVKPQFEAEPREAKRGVVKSPAVQRRILLDIMAFCRDCEYEFRGVTHSPITGAKGNIEFLLFLRYPAADRAEVLIDTASIIDDVIRKAQAALGDGKNQKNWHHV